MPKEYKECVKSQLAKGKAKKDAQRICAISYYKKHGKRPQDVHSSYENSLFMVIDAIFRDPFVKE